MKITTEVLVVRQNERRKNLENKLIIKENVTVRGKGSQLEKKKANKLVKKDEKKGSHKLICKERR